MPQMPFPSPPSGSFRRYWALVSPKEPINHPEDMSVVVGGSIKNFAHSQSQYAKSDAIAFRPKCEEGILSFSYAFSKRGFRFEKTKNIRTKSFPFIIIYICKYECEMRGVFKCVAIFLLSLTVLF